jgi:DNA repair exonuclease SbcCD nuclease subunit
VKLLLVGDPHAKKENLEESVRLRDWIIETALAEKAKVVFMGDQYDNMAIKRVEVEEFWYEFYDLLNARLGENSSVSLTGNHDLNSDGTASAMTVHKKQTQVISGMGWISADIGAISFVRNNEEFIQEAHLLYGKGAKTIFCHAEFNGAEYENGFYAPGGIDLEQCPPVIFISGHIHKAQKLKAASGAEVIYIGTPRHLTRSDAGQIKGIWLYGESGHLEKFIPTPAGVSEPFVEIVVSENEPVSMTLIPKSPTCRIYIDVKGTKEFVDGVLKKLPEGAKVRTFITSDVVKSDIKESEGVYVALEKFLNKYYDSEKVPVEMQKVLSTEIFGKLTGKVADV